MLHFFSMMSFHPSHPFSFSFFFFQFLGQIRRKDEQAHHSHHKATSPIVQYTE